MTAPKFLSVINARAYFFCLVSLCTFLLCDTANAQQDTTRAFQLVDDAIGIKPNDPIKAKELCLEAVAIFESVLEPLDTFLINPYMTLGNIYDDLLDYDTAIEYHKKGVNIYLNADIDHPFKIGSLYNNIGNILTKTGEFEKGLEYLEKAEKQYRDRPEQHYKEKRSRVLGNIGIAYREYGKLEESLLYQKKAIVALEEASDSVTIYTAINYVNYGVALGDEGRYKEALSSHQSARDILVDLMGEDHAYVGICDNNLGLVSSGMGDNVLAVKYYENALAIAMANRETSLDGVAIAYNNLGVMNRKLGDFDKAIDYYEKSKNINQQIYDEGHQVFGDYYQNISTINLYRGDYEKTKLNQDKALEIFINYQGENSIDVAEMYSNYAGLENMLGDPVKGIPYIKKAIEIIEGKLGDENYFLALKYSVLGGSYYLSGQYEEAKSALIKSKELYHLNGIVEEAENAIGLADLAGVYLELGDYDQARASINEAFQILEHDHSKKGFSERSQLYASEFVNVLQALRLLYRVKLNDNNAVYRDSLISLNQDILVINELRIQEAIDPEDKRTSLRDARTHYAHAINDYIDLDLQVEAFALSDKMKGRTLNTSIQKTEYADNFNIPDSIVQLELQYISQVNKYQDNIYRIDYERADSDSIYNVEFDRLYEVKQRRDAYYENLKLDYPAYWKQVYEPGSLSISEIQSKLDGKQTYLQYFIQSDSSMVAFVINKREFTTTVLPQDADLEDRIVAFRDLINSNGDKAVLDEMAEQLYADLLQPLESDLNFEIFISPDGVLSLLPFEVLRKGEQYVIEDHCISYHYSTQLWEFMEQKKVNAQHELLCLAPTFDEWDEDEAVERLSRVRGEYGALLYNQEEAKTVAELWGGEYLSPAHSGLDTFLQLAPHYDILHLATHGKADDRKGEFSYLVLKSDSDTIAQKLYVKDLYGLKMPNQLVVLSACETGTGEVQQGEGIMSMAHGFAMAGSQSIVPSLWSINDKSSSQIIVDFFKNLKTGTKKNEALRNAKLNYLKDNPDASPFYWAPFIAIGDVSPIHRKLSIQSTFTWFVSGFLGLACYLIYRRRGRVIHAS